MSKTPITITVAGKINDPKFQKCVTCAQWLAKEHGEVTTKCLQFYETQWEEYLKKAANQYKGVYYNHIGSPLIFLDNGEYVGGADQFLTWALHNYQYQDNSNSIIYIKKAKNAFRTHINESKTSKFAQLTLSFDGGQHQLAFELFHSIAPRTCENFLTLCSGFERDGLKIGYNGSEVSRIVKGMFIQLGKIPSIEKASIYGGEFADESFYVKHTEIGLLGMCKRNGLKHTNDAQFYITTGAPLTFMDNQNVIFGRVIGGMRAVKMIEKMEVVNERPKNGVKILDGGVYKAQKK